MNNNQSSSLNDLPGVFLRHKKKFLLVTGVIVVIFAAIAISLPPVYRAAATVLIEGQEVPADMVKTTVSGFIDTRLASVEKRVMTGSNILAAVEDFGLYPELRKAGDQGDIVSEFTDHTLREMTSIDSVNPKNGRPILATVSFTISFEGDDPVSVERVANRLAESYLAEHSKLRMEQAKKVSSFLESESMKMNEAITDIESRLAEFKQSNVINLPENMDMNLRSLEKTEERLVAEENTIKLLSEKKRALLNTLDEEAYRQGAFADGGDIIIGVDKKLLLLKAKLSDLRSKYSTHHPDIVKLKSEIAQLEKESQKSDDQKVNYDELEELSYSLFDSVSKTRLDVINKDIAEAKANRAQLLKKIEDYENRLFQAPVVERDYQRLLRDRENAMKVYNDIRDRQMEAKIAEQLEVEEKAERLSIIQPAFVPTVPSGPNRLAIVILGIVVAAGAGVGTVLVADMRDDSIHGEKGIKAVLGMPVIAVIPEIGLPANKANFR